MWVTLVRSAISYAAAALNDAAECAVFTIRFRCRRAYHHFFDTTFIDIQRLLCHNPLQPCILILKKVHPLDFADIRARVLSLLPIKRQRADPRPTAELLHRSSARNRTCWG